MIGSTIVGHRIEERLGEGGMGVVYRARHEQLGKLRALKLLPPHLAQDRQFRERFEREWRLAAAIEHPSIVEILDAGEAEGRLYIVMRLIDGADLATVVAAQGALEPVRVAHILEQIGDALDAAHAAGLVHRDVSPRNILVAASDRAYLADFGVARATAATGLTRTGYFVGNLDYASPEQIEGKAIDGRADIYALGGVLYTSLTGRTPFERETEVQVMYAHLNDAPPAPSAVRDRPPAGAGRGRREGDGEDARHEVPDLRRVRRGAPSRRHTGRTSPLCPRALSGNGAPGKATLLPDGLLTPGSELGEYRIEALIGRGGMGIVYLAERPRLGSKVALKLLSAELAADERFRDRFVRESQMASALDHPNIIPVYDAGEADGRVFIAMRYVDGPSLKPLLEETGSLDLERALNLLAQVGSALDAAHESNLIHRDVKPANILIAKGGASSFGEHVYLTDFGVSKRVGSHSGLTATGQFIGTLSYAAPEQIEGKSVDGRADLYAVACVLYEMLAGSPPFKRDNDVALLWAHVTEPPPRLSEVRDDLPPDLDAAIARGMAKSPDERQPSCAQLIAEVRAACQTRTAAWSSALAATVIVEESATAVDPGSSPPTVAPAVVPPTEPTPVAPIVTSAATVAANVRGDAGNRRRARADRRGHASRQSRTGRRHASRRATGSRRPAADGSRGRPRAEAKAVTQGRRGRPPPHRAHRSRSRNRDRDVVLLRLQDVVRCSAGARDSAGVATRRQARGRELPRGPCRGRRLPGGTAHGPSVGLCPIRSCEGALSRCDRRPSRSPPPGACPAAWARADGRSPCRPRGERWPGRWQSDAATCRSAAGSRSASTLRPERSFSRRRP